MADTIKGSKTLYLPRWVFKRVAEDPKHKDFVDGYHKLLHELGEGDLDLVRQNRVPVIEVTNCDRYLNSLDKYDIYEQFPCVAPILDLWWMEYTRPGRSPEKVGAVFLDIGKEGFEKREHVTSKLIYPEVVAEKGHFFLEVNMYFQQKKDIIGPVAVFHIIADEQGRPIEQTYELSAEYTDQLPSNEVDEPTLWFFRRLAPFLQGISFMHCKNVRIEKNEASDKQQKKRKKNMRAALTKYFTVGIEPFKEKINKASVNADPNDETTVPLTIARGHYAEYGPEFDKGLLFGKIAGRFWVPFHVRGNVKNGVRKKDYEVKDVGSNE